MGYPAVGERWGHWEDAVRAFAALGAGDHQCGWLGGVPVVASRLASGDMGTLLYAAVRPGGSADFLGAHDMASGDGSGVAFDRLGPCQTCGKDRTGDAGHADGCLGTLPGLTQACCGHGHGEPYAMDASGRAWRGEEAAALFRSLGREVPPSRKSGWGSVEVAGVGTVSVDGDFPL